MLTDDGVIVSHVSERIVSPKQLLRGLGVVPAGFTRADGHEAYPVQRGRIDWTDLNTPRECLRSEFWVSASNNSERVDLVTERGGPIRPVYSTFVASPELPGYQDLHIRVIYRADSEGRCSGSLLRGFGCHRRKRA